MMAIEEAGRAQGAAVAVLDTNLLSDLSVPFYEDRMAYRRRAVIFRKALKQANQNHDHSEVPTQAPVVTSRLVR